MAKLCTPPKELIDCPKCSFVGRIADHKCETIKPKATPKPKTKAKAKKTTTTKKK